MKHRRLVDVQREYEQAQAEAARWVAQNDLGSLPGKRLDNGESAGRQRTGHSSNPTSARPTDDLPRRHRDDVSYDAVGGAAEFEQHMVDNGGLFLPLVGMATPLPSFEFLERRARMHHVLSYLSPAQVSVLERKHLEQLTLQEIADEDGVSRQAVHKKLKRAESAFREAFRLHWSDELPLEV